MTQYVRQTLLVMSVAIVAGGVDWSGGFKAKLDYVVPNELNGWNVHLLFSEPVTSLDVSEAVVSKVNDKEYILSNQAWNAVLHPGDKLNIDFTGHGSGVTHPHICVYLEGVDHAVCSSPQGTVNPPTATAYDPGQVCYSLLPGPSIFSTGVTSKDTPTPPPVTVVPTQRPPPATTAIPTIAPTTAAPAGVTSKDTPTPPPVTAVPTQRPPPATTAIPTIAPTTAAPAGVTSKNTPTPPPLTVVPTQRPPPATTAIPTIAPTTAAPAGPTSTKPPPTPLPATVRPTLLPTTKPPIPTMAPAVPTALKAAPWTIVCDFEAPGFCDWTATADALNWTVNHGSTPTAQTGPTADHTHGDSTGGYAYIETSDGEAGDKAGLESPHLTPSQPYCLDFWYHTFGNTLGALNIRIKEKGLVGAPVWTTSGPSQDVWHHAVINIPPQSAAFTLIIEGVRGAAYLGDIAIDDVTLTQVECGH